MLAVNIVQVCRLPRDSLSLGEAKKVFILLSFCIAERPFIEEASDIARLKSSRRALSDRASLFARKLATPPSKTPFFGGISVETRTLKIQDLESTFYAIWLVNLNLPTSKRSHTHARKDAMTDPKLYHTKPSSLQLDIYIHDFRISYA